MRVIMIGTGYVGLVSGACFSDFGHHVICVDRDAEKIASLKEGEIPIFEPGLDKLVEKNIANGRLTFTTGLADSVHDADAVFIAVGTPSRRGDGFADLSFVYGATEEIADALTGYTVVVTKSTVPVGTNREVERIIRERRPDVEMDVASNPEFLREGSAIEDFKRPDRIVVGADGDRARETMRELYRPLYLNETPILFTSRETAEVIKYAGNAFLATKITFINEVADLCEAIGANVQQVARGIGLDNRIGRKFLNAGPGYGGSCFPKDTLALVRTAQEAGTPVTIVEAVIEANKRRKKNMAEKIIATCGGDITGWTIAILGVAFKPNTDDMRDSPALDIVPALQAAGATVKAHDPEAMNEAEKLLPNVEWQSDAYEALEGADAVAIITEWDVYRALDLYRIRTQMKTPIFVDLRNIYANADMPAMGFDYTGIGLGS